MVKKKIGEIIKPRVLTILILLIGGLGMLFMSYACVLDWIEKLNLDINWVVNAWFHPITGSLSMIFFCWLILFLLVRISLKNLKKFANFFNKKEVLSISVVLILISLIIIIISSYFLILEPENIILIIIHSLSGIIFGISMMISTSRVLVSSYQNNSEKTQKLIIIVVIAMLAVFMILVLIGRELGWIVILNEL